MKIIRKLGWNSTGMALASWWSWVVVCGKGCREKKNGSWKKWGQPWVGVGGEKEKKKKWGKDKGSQSCVWVGREKEKKWKRGDEEVGCCVGVLGIGGCVWEEGDEE